MSVHGPHGSLEIGNSKDHKDASPRVETEPYTAPSNECALGTLRPFRSRQPAKSGPHPSGGYICFQKRNARAYAQHRLIQTLYADNSGVAPP